MSINFFDIRKNNGIFSRLIEIYFEYCLDQRDSQWYSIYLKIESEVMEWAPKMEILIIKSSV
jgi:hypothetical protein